MVRQYHQWSTVNLSMNAKQAECPFPRENLFRITPACTRKRQCSPRHGDPSVITSYISSPCYPRCKTCVETEPHNELIGKHVDVAVLRDVPHICCLSSIDITETQALDATPPHLFAVTHSFVTFLFPKRLPLSLKAFLILITLVLALPRRGLDLISKEELALRESKWLRSICATYAHGRNLRIC